MRATFIKVETTKEKYLNGNYIKKNPGLYDWKVISKSDKFNANSRVLVMPDGNFYFIEDNGKISNFVCPITDFEYRVANEKELILIFD